jgi:hypothetical protein
MLAVCAVDPEVATHYSRNNVLLVLLTTLLRLYQIGYHLNTTPLFLIKVGTQRHVSAQSEYVYKNIACGLC